jgi:hypothetical protein
MPKCIIDSCRSDRIRARGLCKKHWSYEQYGVCINGCIQPAANKKGLCDNCIKRGGNPPYRRNDGKCNKCGNENLINSRCKVCDTHRKKNENLMRRYGISLKEWNDTLTKQGNSCKICNRWSKRFVVDHDHSCCKTKKTCGKCVRGIICENCNRAIGLIDDSTIVLRSMIKYLEGK